jgi:hypothetical protein
LSRRKWKTVHKGTTLRSGFEKKVAQYLDKHKVEYEYETQVLAYTIPASKHRYTPDYILPNGIIIEVKGNFTAPQRKKMAAVIEQHPDKDIRMLFMRDNKISKSSNTKYSDWCEKRGVKYHVSANGTVPEDWLTEKPTNNKE